MRRSKSILWKWGISYLCLFLIPLFSIFINYYSNEKNLKKEYVNAFQLTLNNINNALDTCINDMKSFQSYIQHDDFYTLLRRNNPEDLDFIFNTHKFQTSLSLYNDANTELSCAVYYNNLEFISTPEFGHKTNNYYNRLCLTSATVPPYEEWLSFLTTNYNNAFLVHTALSTTDTPCLIYAHTMQRAEKYSTIFITFPLTELVPLLNLLSEGTFFVIQSSDNLLYTFDRNGQYSSQPTISLDENNNLLLPEDYISVSSSPKEQGFICHLVVSDRVLDDHLANVRNNFILTLTVTLLLGIIGVVLLLYANYQPVSKMLVKLNVNSAGKNEFQSISSTYEELQKEYHAARTTVQHQDQELMNSWLLSLLKGRISGPDIHKKERAFDLNSDAHVGLVGFMIPPSDQTTLEYDDLLFFIVDNIFQELFEGYNFYHIEDGRFIFYLFQLKEQDTWQDFALKKVDYLCSLLNEKWGSTVVGVVSKTPDSLVSCKFLYREVMEGFEQQKVSGGSTVIDTRSMDTRQTPEHIRDAIEQELDAAVKEGDLKAALNISARIFDAEHEVPFSTQKAYAFDAFSLVLGIFNTYIANPIQQMNAMNYITPLLQASTSEELISSFNQTLIFVCSEIAQKWQSESKDIVLKIKKYVEKNYTDQNLSVSAIAYAVERNPKYISRIFKETTGDGLLDYINRYRINKARELMQLDQYTLAEISDQVGYANVRAFRRAFVKLIGEIPSKYNK